MSYSHQNVFGCKAFAHVPKEQRTKLDNKSVPFIFIVYRDEDFWYRLWDPVKKKVIRSRDVIFREIEGGNADDLFEKANKKRVAEQEEQPNEIIEQRGKLGDNIKQVEYPKEEEQSQPLWRSERQRVESSKCPSLEYVLINDEGEPESNKKMLSHPG
ncbi:hypothetical protein KY284_011068 [Solanum tuberosum]|nr:hypothetical protein KY284_011068 [Solanum tuberosum]